MIGSFLKRVASVVKLCVGFSVVMIGFLALNSIIRSSEAERLADAAELKFLAAHSKVGAGQEDIEARIKLIEGAQGDVRTLLYLFPFSKDGWNILTTGRSGAVDPTAFNLRLDAERMQLLCATDPFVCLNEKIAKVFRFANISVIRSLDVRWIGAAANKLELLISADLEAEYPHEFLLLALKERDYDAVFNFAVTQRRHEVLLAHVLMRSGRDDQARAVFGAVRSYLDAENSDNWDLVLDLEGKYFGEKFDSYLTYAYRDLGDFHMQDDWRSYEKLVRVLLAVSRYGSSSVKQPFLDKVSERLMIPISQGRSGAASILNFRLSASACIAHLRGNGEMRNALLRLLNKVDVNEENLIELVFVPAQIMYTCGQRDISWLYAEDFINLSMKVDRKDRDLIVAVSEAYEILGDDKELGLYLDKTVAEIGTSEMGGASSLDDWRSIGRIMEVYGAFLTGLSVEQYRSLN